MYTRILSCGYRNGDSATVGTGLVVIICMNHPHPLVKGRETGELESFHVSLLAFGPSCCLLDPYMGGVYPAYQCYVE